jgi:hypothetical protein
MILCLVTQNITPPPQKKTTTNNNSLFWKKTYCGVSSISVLFMTGSALFTVKRLNELESGGIDCNSTEEDIMGGAEIFFIETDLH